MYDDKVQISNIFWTSISCDWNWLRKRKISRISCRETHKIFEKQRLEWANKSRNLRLWIIFWFIHRRMRQESNQPTSRILFLVFSIHRIMFLLDHRLGSFIGACWLLSEAIQTLWNKSRQLLCVDDDYKSGYRRRLFHVSATNNTILYLHTQNNSFSEAKNNSNF